ncbi:MAG: hypothetical protein ABI305_04915, partial [Tepidiformaceae bacterium]
MSEQAEHGVAVDDLTEAERRLYELARQTMPLAEMAVRLGVPTGDAERPITALLGRLNLPDRAALQQDATATAPSEAVNIGEGAAAELEPGVPGARGGISRRALLGGAIAVGGLVAASVAGVVVFGGGGSKTKPASVATPPASTATSG